MVKSNIEPQFQRVSSYKPVFVCYRYPNKLTEKVLKTY